MAKWSRSGKKINAESTNAVFNEGLSEAELQRIWDQANAKYPNPQPGDIVTVYPSQGDPITTQVPANPNYVPKPIIGTPISATPMPDPLERIIEQAVYRQFSALIRDQDITIAALQDQIDELWAELRDE